MITFLILLNRNHDIEHILHLNIQFNVNLIWQVDHIILNDYCY